MECGLVGLPGSGKTSLLAALSGSAYSALAGGGMKPHVGVGPIPDPRLGVIARYVRTKRIVHATLQLVDIPGVPPGSDARMLNKFLEHVRQVEAVCHVVRCFDDGTGVRPAADIAKMDTELVLADLIVAESAADKAAKAARAGEREAQARREALERALETLNEGRPVRGVEWTGEQARLLRSYGLITLKPVLYVANVAEDDLTGRGPAASAVAEHAAATGGQAVAVCAKLEAELAELAEADRAEMLATMGLSEPAIGPLARALNELLGLGTFYTAGDKEIRAWTIPLGATAPAAAGAIHSDIERGFIRAECYSVDDLERHHSEKAIREAGRLRSEGKAYTMQDGDVVHFLFNV
jgi:hypothetical protein